MPVFATTKPFKKLKIRTEEIDEDDPWAWGDYDSSEELVEHHGTPVRVPKSLPEEDGYKEWSKAAEKRIPTKPIYSEVKVPTAKEVQEHIKETKAPKKDHVELLTKLSKSLLTLIDLQTEAKEILNNETIDDIFSLHLMEAEVKKMVGDIGTWEKTNKVQLLPAE